VPYWLLQLLLIYFGYFLPETEEMIEDVRNKHGRPALGYDEHLGNR
jgi:hypothetical protein